MNNQDYKHTPVMLKEVIEYLDPKPGEKFIDCTLGGGGYTLAISDKVGKRGKVLAVDLDEMAIKNLEFRIKNLEFNNIILSYGNFKNLQQIVKENRQALSGVVSGDGDEEGGEKNMEFDGIVFDLGLSSAQLADKSRGFSFQLDAPLDMSFGYNNEWPQIKERMATNFKTEDIVNKWKQEELEKIIRGYGEERYAGRIARAIIENRKIKPIRKTGELVDIIEKSVPGNYKHKKIHFATRTFQALRIATNDELKNLEEALPQAVSLLKKGGKIIIISFHSLEDRIVKNFFKKENKDCICPPSFPMCQCEHRATLKILTKKPLLPSDDEIEENPRARSAKMRIAERTWNN